MPRRFSIVLPHVALALGKAGNAATIATRIAER
jgi:hypothetical protein